MLDYIPLARGLYLEALHVCEDGVVWFSDVMLGGIRRLRGDGGVDLFLPERDMIGSVIQNADGKLLVAGGGNIVWLDPATGASGVAIDSVEGEALPGANEMCADGRGGLIFGTLDLAAIRAGRKPAPAAIVHLAADGTARRMTGALSFCNGVALSADGRTLWHNESFTSSFVYDVAADGTLGEKRLFVEKPDCDGIAVDAEGWLWITGYATNHLLRMAPDGSARQEVALPEGMACTSIRFGGPGLGELYVNTVPVDAAQKLVELRPLEPDASVLYRAKAPVPGRVTAPPALRLG